MTTLVIVLIAAVVLVCAYAFYGRWVAKTWGVNPNAQTPAVKYNDGKDYVPTNGWTVFSHQFSSIAGAGPVTGAIQAAAFGWLPVLLWVLIGGIFFGAMHDFGALFASIRHKGQPLATASRSLSSSRSTSARPAASCSCCSAGCSAASLLQLLLIWLPVLLTLTPRLTALPAWLMQLPPTAQPVWFPSCSCCSLLCLA